MECADTMPFSASFVLFAFAVLLLSFAFAVVMHTIDNVWPKLLDFDRDELRAWMNAHTSSWTKLKNWSEK